eukprot:2232413-Lingulodinium_polyedra.AAC.1
MWKAILPPPNRKPCPPGGGCHSANSQLRARRNNIPDTDLHPSRKSYPPDGGRRLAKLQTRAQ